MRLPILLVFALVTATSAAQNYLEIYSGVNQTGDGIILRSKLDTLGHWEYMIRQGRSYCFVGWWKTYSKIEYQGTQIRNIYSPTRHCSNGEFSSDQSLRYYGPPDFTTSAISLYNGSLPDLWAGNEIIVQAQAATNFAFIPTGIVLTGTASWTTFTNNDFTGNTTCYTGFQDVTSVRAQEPIHSLVKGCESYPIDRYVFESQTQNAGQGSHLFAL
jgi:hypothetical protein